MSLRMGNDRNAKKFWWKEPESKKPLRRHMSRLRWQY